MGGTVEDVGWDREGREKGKEEREGMWLVLNWLDYELIKICVVHGVWMVPNCLSDSSAPVPKCLNILWRGRSVQRTLRH